ncbi:hypothetical protein L211DRAFT_675070 [Terfezia boudieri ATCC MYA-4762]|uniref:Transmembrane protein n=1 Tax=Terfezia boudieri ATCC MYA-4762 TaxID=1051890 RepID=A0A3N4LU35_9PEZI|nr:hypothetical protein L211DRAFT_675070 [Terfezia boudieri ATCC MYA-4762]
MRSPFLMSISAAKYITSDDAAFPTLLPSSNNHRMPLIWALLLSSSIHLRVRPGLYLVGAACKTTACVRTCVVRLVGGVAICAVRSGWTISISFCDVGRLFGGFGGSVCVVLSSFPLPFPASGGDGKTLRFFGNASIVEVAASAYVRTRGVSVSVGGSVLVETLFRVGVIGGVVWVLVCVTGGIFVLGLVVWVLVSVVGSGGGSSFGGVWRRQC